MGPVRTPSHKGKRYIFVCVDDFSRFCWVDFLREKSDTFESFQRLCLKEMMEKGATIWKIIRLRSDHGREFKNKDFADFCDRKGIHHEFSAPKTPQQNGVVERRNKTLQEMARVMLLSKGLPEKLWAEAINTACYITNRVFFRPFTHKTPYELYKGKRPTVSHFHNFGSTSYILCDRESLGKFAARSDEGIFLGYSTNSRAYRVYNKRTQVVMESINVTVFDDVSQSQRIDEDLSIPSPQTQNDSIPDIEGVSEGVPVAQKDDTFIESPKDDTFIESPKDDTFIESPKDDTFIESPKVDTSIQDQSDVTKRPSRIQKNHPTEAIIGDLNDGVKTRGKHVDFRDMVHFVCYTSSQEPKKVEEALHDEYWVLALQEELHQFERNKVWRLVPRPVHNNIIGTKWIFKNKTDAAGKIIRNKARLVAQGYTQVEGVDFEETFTPVARLGAIRLMISIACQLKIKLYQMDIKSAFLNGYISEEVFVEQPKGFIDPHYPDHVYQLSKALYGLKQAPRAWYDRLTSFLIGHEYCRAMKQEFEMSMVGELSIFLGFQIKQLDNGIFLSQEKYAKEMVRKFGMEHTKPKATPMGTNENLNKDLEGVGTDPHLYRSMIGSLLYLIASRPDLCFSVGVCTRYQANLKESHQAVKRILRYVHGTTKLGVFYSNSSTMALAGYSDTDWAGNSDDQKTEYIAAGSCCTQLQWMKQMLADYGFDQDTLTVLCDNTSAIDISKNPVQHSRTNHIDIRNHFIREPVTDKIISLEYISTANQLAYIFTKNLDRTRCSRRSFISWAKEFSRAKAHMEEMWKLKLFLNQIVSSLISFLSGFTSRGLPLCPRNTLNQEIADLMESSPSSLGKKKGSTTLVDRVVSFFLAKSSSPRAVETELKDPPKVAVSTPSSSSLLPPPIHDELAIEAAPAEQPKATATAITPPSLVHHSVRDESQTEEAPHISFKAQSHAAISGSPPAEESSAQSSSSMRDSLILKDDLQHIVQKSLPRPKKVPVQELKSIESEQQVSSRANTSASSSTESEEPVVQVESHPLGIASRLRPRMSKEGVPTLPQTPGLRSKKGRIASVSVSEPVQEVPNVSCAKGDGETAGTVAMPVLLPDVDPVLVDKQAKKLWNAFSPRKFILELPICETEYEKADLLPVLSQTHLRQFALFTAKFHPVWLRGHYYEFSPAILDMFVGVPSVDEIPDDASLDEIISELTGGYKKQWVSHRTFPTSALTTKYYGLHKAAISHWMPTGHYTIVNKALARFMYRVGKSIPVNLGKIIFDQVINFVENLKHYASMMFPSTIYSILVSQKEFELPPGPLCFWSVPLKISTRKASILTGQCEDDTDTQDITLPPFFEAYSKRQQ
ncbi:hypothetical protein H6P81_011317 [Aristolochia fimbriata]|uniref:Integrase catalytic domain-containing protein n=1 Tax=Aristolochia fimbriata TaxID=158543 RepID=A0AAV7EUN5_ARIFI|nr:hypothetical protein H6P81_011317 [Aristolochia fimbriata]